MQNDRGDICRKSSFSVKPACMQTDGHKSSSGQPKEVGKCFCSNYSLVLGRREDGVRKGAVEMKASKVTAPL